MITWNDTLSASNQNISHKEPQDLFQILPIYVNVKPLCQSARSIPRRLALKIQDQTPLLVQLALVKVSCTQICPMPGTRRQAATTSDVLAYMLINYLIICPGQTGHGILTRCVMLPDQTDDSGHSLVDRCILSVHDEKNHVLQLTDALHFVLVKCMQPKLFDK